MASPEVRRPQLRRVSTIEYDVSQLCAPIKKLGLEDSKMSSNITLASKSIRSAIGTPAFEKTMRESGNAVPSTNGSGSGGGGGGGTGGGGGEYRASDLQRMVDSISETLTDETCSYGAVGVYRHYCRDVQFEPNGCQWDATVVPIKVEGGGKDDDRNALDKAREAGAHKFGIRVICHALPKEKGGEEDGEGENDVCYAVKMDLLDTEAEDSGMSSHDRKERLALVTKIFDEVGLDIKKALVRCEFPEFPEGRKGRAFREVYQLNARLKSGSFATVCRGTHRASGRKVAIKCVLRKDLPPSDDAAIYDEVAILASLRHRYVVPLIDFFEEKECYFLVMELMAGGDLFDRIGQKKTYTERDARELCIKMIEAVKYLHDSGIAHCDMKPKNLLLKSEEDDSFIKLADFGFATRVYSPGSLTKQCGTPFFVAPEILMRVPYDQGADMWSVGVIIYLLLGGTLPFMGRSQRELFRAIVVGKYDFPDDAWKNISDSAKDLIRKLLVTDPNNRFTAAQVIDHAWLKADGRHLSRNDLMFTSQRLKTFNARMKLRSAMIAVDWVSKTSVWRSARDVAKTKPVEASSAGGAGGHASKIEEGDEESE